MNKKLISVTEGEPLPHLQSSCCGASLNVDNFKFDMREEGEEIVLGMEGIPTCMQCGKDCGVDVFEPSPIKLDETP